MSKSLIIICDGTMQSFSDRNILVTLLSHIPNTETQLVYYDPGVATLGTRWRKLFDGATGRGLMKNLKEAYSFLCSNYQEGDRVYAIGYSRGAATIRLLVDFISRIGLVPKHLENILPQALEAYLKNDEETLEILAKLTPEEAPFFEKVFVLDTCFGNQCETSYYKEFLSDSWKNIVKNLYHFIAGSEERGFLYPFRWTKGALENIFYATFKESIIYLDHSQIAFSKVILTFIAIHLEKEGITKEPINLEKITEPKPWKHWYSFLVPKRKRILLEKGESLERDYNPLD